MTQEERFAQVFRMNIARRSRTAKGKDEGAKTSSKKKHLLLSGEELKKQVVVNTEKLIADVVALPIEKISPSKLREMANLWFDITTERLCDLSAYEEEFKTLEAAANRFGRSLGTPIQINRNYRLWTPKYTTANIPPLWLEKFMDEFYFDLSLRMCIMRDIFPAKDSAASGAASEQAAQIMAYADLMMDGEIHPWIDGCGRVSTALVMYIARYLQAPLPLFAPTREEHYASINDIEKHTNYFWDAMMRAKQEVPE
ncbi:hypothetical protein HYT45_04255 [Candidatus Uhrbacteria bacterium]|nr:hypothetical protein [Candidatus Uhrbacteria bacterium]